MGNSYASQCATDAHESDGAAVRLPQRCNPDKTENPLRDDHKPGTTNERIGCTEPPPGFSHGSCSTSRPASPIDCHARYLSALLRASFVLFALLACVEDHLVFALAHQRSPLTHHSSHLWFARQVAALRRTRRGFSRQLKLYS